VQEAHLADDRRSVSKGHVAMPDPQTLVIVTRRTVLLYRLLTTRTH
jgi:hypothetical protein